VIGNIKQDSLTNISKKSGDKLSANPRFINHGRDGELYHRYQIDSDGWWLPESCNPGRHVRGSSAGQKYKKARSAESVEERRDSTCSPTITNHGGGGEFRHL
jgi:hypothetical protein